MNKIGVATEKKFKDKAKDCRVLVELFDKVLFCASCNSEHDFKNCIEAGTRNLILHTLHHSSFTAAAKHFICTECSFCLPFEGKEVGLFCLDKEHVCRRELLVSWLMDMRSAGGTLRDVFFACESKSLSTTAVFQCIDGASSLSPQTANEALSKFRMLLRFPSSSEML